MTSTKTIVNCYELLQVAEDCTVAILASAYRRLALKHHPDRNRDDPTANDRFLQLRKAYDTLMDPVQRKEHDLALNSAREQQRRTESMDAERRRMRDELLKREQQASMASTVHEQQSHHKYGHMPQQYQQPWKQRRQQRRQRIVEKMHEMLEQERLDAEREARYRKRQRQQQQQQQQQYKREIHESIDSSQTREWFKVYGRTGISIEAKKLIDQNSSSQVGALDRTVLFSTAHIHPENFKYIWDIIQDYGRMEHSKFSDDKTTLEVVFENRISAARVAFWGLRFSPGFLVTSQSFQQLKAIYEQFLSLSRTDKLNITERLVLI